jgi:chorismate mutase
MDEIKKLRKHIDKIDLKVLTLLNERSNIAARIGIEKKSNNLFRPERQAHILKQLLNNKQNTIKPEFILAFWRTIFLSQIDIQGGIKVIIPKNIGNIDREIIFDYFSHDIKIIETDSIKKALEKTNKEKNILLVLPYPRKNNNLKWWIKKGVENLYIVSALPFFLKKSKHPSLVLISRYEPVIEKDFYALYISKIAIKDKNLTLVDRASKFYLYKSNRIVKNKNLKLFGILPKHYEF